MSNSTESSPPVPNETDVASSKGLTKNSRQRFKPQLSCTFCRNRKLKCDRNLPCENCLKRNQAPSCTYVHATLREKTSKVEKAGNGTKDVQSQIRHLEDLVISLMNQTTSNVPPQSHRQATPESSPEHLDDVLYAENARNASLTGTAESFGRISIEDKKQNYVGGDHWVAILDSIACLKDRLDNTELPKPPPDLTPGLPGPELLVGSVKAASRAEILSVIPARAVVDSLIQGYFATPDIGASMLHKPTFMREYHSFWLDPNKTPIAWIGMLYSIICLCAHFELIGAFSFTSFSDSVALRDPQDMIDIFREKTIQCLVLSNYTDPGPYTIETMLLYYVSDHFRSPDAQFGGWMVFGLIVRASMRLGLHRDASHYPNISTFKGEMMRRLWAAILHMDLQTSNQVGLPRMLKEGMYDTKQPRNLLDEDFDENTTVLPPARSEVDATTIGYSNSKHAITEVFGMIVDQANSVHPTTYEEVMKLDKLLYSVYDKVPESLKVRNVADLATGIPIARVRKFAIDLTFQKARCILHRRFFVIASSSSTSYPYPYSLKACIEAAMRILDSQMYMYSETALGKQLYGHRWKTSSLMLHDFLLAAMLVCLYLGHSISKGAEERERAFPETGIRIKWTQEEMRKTIQGSLKIWEETSDTSTEARKAANALRAMLSKIPSPDQVMTDASDGSQSTQNTTPATLAYSTPQSIPLPVTAPVVLGATSTSWDLINSIPNPLSSDALNGINSSDASLFAPLNAESLDWQLWDEQFYANRPGDVNMMQDMWAFDPTGAGAGAGAGGSVGGGSGEAVQFTPDVAVQGGFVGWEGQS